MRPLPLAVALLSLGPAALAAQTTAPASPPARPDSAPALVPTLTPALTRGARVRARVDGAWRTGRLDRVGPDTLWLAAPHTGAPALAVALRDAVRLEVRRRATRREGARRWALRGLAAGAALGAGWCLTDQRNCTAEIRGGKRLGEGMAGAAMFFGGAGAMYGAVGGAILRGHRWETARRR